MTKRYSSVIALEDVSLEFRAGCIHLLAGSNGAGKTTLMRCLVGLARPSAGSAWINGVPFARLGHPSHIVGACLDPIRLPSLRSGRQHLTCLATAGRLPRQRVDDVLEMVGVPDDVAARRAGTYSLGTRQRLTLAAALLGDPEILVLDEPTTGLDAHGVSWLCTKVREFANDGRTVLLASHSLTEIGAVVDRAVILDGGRVVSELSRTDLDDDRGLSAAVSDVLPTAYDSDK